MTDEQEKDILDILEKQVAEKSQALRTLVDYCSTDDEYDTLLEHVLCGGDKKETILWQAAIIGGFTDKLDTWLKEELEKKNK